MFCSIKIWLKVLLVILTNIVNMHNSDELKRRRSSLLSNVNVSSAHQAMLWTKYVPLFCQQM